MGDVILLDVIQKIPIPFWFIEDSKDPKIEKLHEEDILHSIVVTEIWTLLDSPIAERCNIPITGSEH